VTNADGSQTALIRDFRSRPSTHEPQNGHTGALNWSPTGLELVYEGMAHSLVAIDAATGDIRVLLDGFYTGDPTSQPALSPDLDAAPGYQGMVAVRGPDGSFDAGGMTQFDIFVAPIVSDANGRLLPIDRTQIVNATNSPGTDEFHPSWSPDGSAIACFHDDGTDEWLAVIDVPTGVLVPIYPDYATQVNGDDRAAWTSDGLNLIYRTELSGIDPFDLSIIAADGAGGPANYTKTANRRERAPAWNPRWDPAGPGAF
jgi:hypothetical protein